MKKMTLLLAVLGLALYGCKSENKDNSGGMATTESRSEQPEIKPEEEKFFGQYRSENGLAFLVLMDRNRCEVGGAMLSVPCKWSVSGGEIKVNAIVMGIQSVTTAQSISENTLLYDKKKYVRIQNNIEEVRAWLAKVHQAEAEKLKYAQEAKDIVVKSFNASFPNNSLASIASNKSSADPTTFGKCAVGDINDKIKSKSIEFDKKYGREYVKQTLTLYADSVLGATSTEVQKIYKEDKSKSLSSLYGMIDDIQVNGERGEFSSYNRCHTILPMKKTRIDEKQAFWGIQVSGNVNRPKRSNLEETIYGKPVAKWESTDADNIGTSHSYKGGSIDELTMLSDSMSIYDEANTASYYKFGTIYSIECPMGSAIVSQLNSEFGAESAIILTTQYERVMTNHIWFGDSLAVIAQVTSESNGRCSVTAYNFKKAMAYASSIEKAKRAKEGSDAKNAEIKKNKALSDM